MKDIEAFEITMKCLEEGKLQEEQRSYDYMHTVVDALEKQIPKKPAKERFLDRYICPNCNKPLRTHIDVENCRFDGYERVSLYQAHCEECGQAVDWSEE